MDLCLGEEESQWELSRVAMYSGLIHLEGKLYVVLIQIMSNDSSESFLLQKKKI